MAAPGIVTILCDKKLADVPAERIVKVSRDCNAADAEEYGVRPGTAGV
ncbi:hypothetical protein [Reyranella sp.]